MSEVKCQVFPSGTNSWHVWEVGAKEGDLCECGAQRLVNLTPNPESPQAKLTEMEAVLSWASEHLLCCNFDGRDKQWCVEGRFVHYSPTLYAALKSAWEARDK